MPINTIDSILKASYYTAWLIDLIDLIDLIELIELIELIDLIDTQKHEGTVILYNLQYVNIYLLLLLFL